MKYRVKTTKKTPDLVHNKIFEIEDLPKSGYVIVEYHDIKVRLHVDDLEPVDG